MKRYLFGALAILASSPVAAHAQSPLSFPPPVPAEPAQSANAIYLYPGKVPGSEQARESERWEHFLGQRIVRNVVRPTITPVLPEKDRATGEAVLIAPGGGYLFLSIDKEGLEAARWLADHGIAAFVLKYRLDETPTDPAAFAEVTAARFGAAMSGGTPPTREWPFALADAQAAMRLIRARAGEWGIDPAHVGYLGFSAGARTGLRLVMAGEPGTRPAFAALIYGPQEKVAVPADAPPLFSALAADDPIYGGGGFGLIQAWRKAGRPVEFHYYEKGGHGFGMKEQGTTSDDWKDELLHWIRTPHSGF